MKQLSDFMETEDIDKLNKITKVKHTVLSIIKPELIRDLLVESVDETELLDFLSPRGRRISPNKISLTLKLNRVGFIEKYDIKSENYNTENLDIISYIHEELMVPFTEKLTKIIKENEEGIRELDSESLDPELFVTDKVESMNPTSTMIDLTTKSTMSSVSLAEGPEGLIIANINYLS